MRKSAKKERISDVVGKEVTRRSFLKGVGTLGLGLAATSSMNRLAFAQPKGPIKLSFWTWQNPQQHAWIQKRVKLFMEKNKGIQIDWQYFTFTDLGKKISVGYATGTAPEGFATGTWLMPTWLSRNMIAPLDIKLLGYSSLQSFVNDYPKAFIDGAVKNDKVYGYPVYVYGFLNYLNTKQFKEAKLDPEKDQPKTWEELGEIARKLAIKKGNKFERQGFKFAMHAPMWTMVQFNPILLQCGGSWFDKSGKCTVNSNAGVRAMTIRASIIRKYQAEDPADSIATSPLPMMDFLKERVSMFSTHCIPIPAVKSQNEKMAAEGYYRPVQMPGVDPNKRYPTAYGFNFVVNINASKEKQEALHDLYRFIMSDLVDCWKDTGPFTPARKSGWADDPQVKSYPHIDEIIKARDNGALLPETPVVNELSDIMHQTVQKVTLENADIKKALDEAAVQVDKATEEFKNQK
ncbi:MAG: extracellular solute-binding protein [Thermodesulfobacteriota bacterium]|jgi:multiple sugar transport system substrate-binding protein